MEVFDLSYVRLDALEGDRISAQWIAGAGAEGNAVKHIALVVGRDLEGCACHAAIGKGDIYTYVLVGVEAPGRPAKRSTSRAAAANRNSKYIRVCSR